MPDDTWRRPFCAAPPFAVPSLRNQHIREEHPDQEATR